MQFFTFVLFKHFQINLSTFQFKSAQLNVICLSKLKQLPNYFGFTDTPLLQLTDEIGKQFRTTMQSITTGR